jgi:nucleotide-binding universal stress UspA family protein
MSFKKALLYLPTYPDAPPEQVLQCAAFFSQKTGASLTAVIPELSPDPATWPVVMGGWVDVPALISEAVHISATNTAKLAGDVQQVAADFTVPIDVRKASGRLFPSSGPLIDLARLHDILILPVPESNDFDRDIVHPAIFGTARPTLLLPHGRGRKHLHRLDRIVVAWDFSREAARALIDAMPLLIAARQVVIVTVLGEKGIQTSASISDLQSFLAAHGVTATFEETTIRHESIGDCIGRFVTTANADMLVMGAYGHSRAREFVLGGATKSLISDPPLPVFLSH